MLFRHTSVDKSESWVLDLALSLEFLADDIKFSRRHLLEYLLSLALEIEQTTAKIFINFIVKVSVASSRFGALCVGTPRTRCCVVKKVRFSFGYSMLSKC